ncbi:hypothetical protein [Sandarakinorhabdus sp. AAP62]|uniref:hypothetical protein n=1 Tax=Sandarakinorhabdus sp. AAP62 TaxID=1248916 RepID=UPI00037BAFC4|nr:hypothetical protein [Sandarakinorhabdus sp. AAP62]
MHVIGGDVPPIGFAGSVAAIANLPGGQRARVMQDRQAGTSRGHQQQNRQRALRMPVPLD